MLKEHRGGRPWRVRYYRGRQRGLAAVGGRRRRPRPPTRSARRDVLHLTGITAALGPARWPRSSAPIEVARAAGTLVSFDVNHRATLWSDDEAAPVLARLAAAADLVFAGPEEAALVLGRERPAGPAAFDDGEVLARELAKLGPATVVVKLGALGALALSGDEVHRAPARPVTVVDPVGAGDAFVAGYLSEVVAGGPVARLPADGQRARRRRLRGARGLGGPAHPRRAGRSDPDSRGRRAMTRRPEHEERAMSEQDCSTAAASCRWSCSTTRTRRSRWARPCWPAGIDVVEITLRTDAGLEAIRPLALAARDARRRRLGPGPRPGRPGRAGAGPGSSSAPACSADVVLRCRALDVPALPGVATASDLMAASALGLDEVKFFPAGLLGGRRRSARSPRRSPGCRSCPPAG